MAVDVEAVDVEATWHHFGATYLGTELGAMDFGIELDAIRLDTEALTCIFWHLK